MSEIASKDWFSDPALRRVLDLLNEGEGEARIVGGAVRNALMGLPVSDIDIATSLAPPAVMERATAAGIKAVPTGIAHGTVTLVIEGRPFEVTTLRRDVTTDGRHATVSFTTDWQADAQRRDLTINALYADPDGTVVDLVDGLKDIETRMVRFIGDPAARIAEDYLRILRFFRFFASYGSGRPDAAGLKACAAAKDKLSGLSAERIWSETKKLLGAADPGRALLWMRQVGVLTAILPETEKWGIDAVPALVATETALGWSPEPLLRLSAIVPPDGARLDAMAKRLRLSKDEAALLQDFAKAPTLSDTMAHTAFDRLLYEHGARGLAMRVKLALASARAKAEGGDIDAMQQAARLTALLDRAVRWTKPSFPLSGADALAAGFPAGPAVGKALTALEQQWLESNFTLDRASLLARLQEMN